LHIIQYRTGLHSKATNRKEETWVSVIVMIAAKKQHFSFEYKKPYQPNTLSAATIIAWDTNQTSSLMAKSKMPPMAKR
jgi:hypothetical protein